MLDARLIVEGLIQEHQPEQGHREAYCSCGSPIGLWGTEWPKHISELVGTILDEALAAATPSKVYVVTSGQYSDMTVNAVFADRATADIYAGTDRYVEEFELNTPASTARFYWPIYVRGAAPQAPRLEESSPYFLKAGRELPSSNVRIHSQRRQIGADYRRYIDAEGERVIEGTPILGWLDEWRGEVYGRSPEQARKIAADLIAKAQSEHLLELERRANEGE
jgi:hypothetical protein